MSVKARRRIVWGALALLLLATVGWNVSGAGLSGGLRAPWRGLLAPQLVTWSSFTPTGWITVLPVASSITAVSPIGLEPATAEYAISTDGGNGWSPWRKDNLSVSGAFTTTQTLAVSGLNLPEGATNNFIRYRIGETSGASAMSASYPLLVDTQAPAAPIGLTATPSGWTNTNSFSVAWTNPVDGVGIVGAWRQLDSPPTAWDDGVYVAAQNSIADIALPNDGEHTVYVWLQDSLGRADHRATAATVLRLDRVPPPAPYALRGQPAYTWTNVNSFSESWTNPFDLSGIVGAYYQLNELPGSEWATPIRVDTPASISGITAPGSGKHNLYLWLVDGAGNSSLDNWAAHPQVFWYDDMPPSSMVALMPSPAASGWYTSTVSATFSGVDQVDLSGLQAVHWQLDNAPDSAAETVQIAVEGQHKLVYRARDHAGNEEWPKEIDFSIDRTPPVIALTASSQPQPSGWYTTSVTLTLSISDTISGVAASYYRLNSGPWQTPRAFTLTTDGTYQVDYYGEDLAGNRSAIGAMTVKMDAQPPATAYQIEGTPAANGWYVAPVTVKLVPQDGGSGVASTLYSINGGPWQSGTEFTLVTDGIYSLSFYSTDASGNREISFPVEIKLDSFAPAAPTAVETLPAVWSRTNSFSVKWANPTDLSGLAGVYYRLDQEPAHAKDGVFVPLTTRLDGLTVPSEGAHRLYLWLQDGAGNASTENKAQAPLLRYDATAPEPTVTVLGQSGENGWYRSPVTVTIRANDVASGVKALSYRIDGGDWVTSTQTLSFGVKDADKHVIEYAAEDAAGNVSPIKTYTLRIDMTSPPAPHGLMAEPVGWHRFNSFGLYWLPTTDQSGIGGVYVKVDAAPISPTDGVFYAGATSTGGITVPIQGKHSVWVWLRDGAGNADHQTAAVLDEALWYDGTPPVTTVTRSGTMGLNGWYQTPVLFTASAEDDTSDVAEIRYQVDDKAWVTSAEPFAFAEQGLHVVRVAAVDQAGNMEPAQAFHLKLDTQPPDSRLDVPARLTETQFEVRWTGADLEPGSGLFYYDLLWRDGYLGGWQSFQQHTQATSAPFNGERGHMYFFQVIATDRAGNRQIWPTIASVTIDALLNGAFDTGNFDSWTPSGILYKAVIPTPNGAGRETQVARLGTDAYGPSVVDPGNVPVGNATISQSVWVADIGPLKNSCLSFAYRIFSYDVMYSARLGRYVDTLDVTVTDGGGRETILMRAGNPTTSYGRLYDSGWRYERLNIQPWAGQRVTVAFANHNRNDNLFNTWSYVDDIRIGECHLSFMPDVIGSGMQPAPALSVDDVAEMGSAAEFPAELR